MRVCINLLVTLASSYSKGWGNAGEEDPTGVRLPTTKENRIHHMHGAVAGFLHEQHHRTWRAILLNTMQALKQLYIDCAWIGFVCLPMLWWKYSAKPWIDRGCGPAHHGQEYLSSLWWISGMALIVMAVHNPRYHLGETPLIWLPPLFVFDLFRNIFFCCKERSKRSQMVTAWANNKERGTKCHGMNR